MGSMTGRAAGYCAGYGMPGYARFTPERALNTGFGRGRRGWNRGYGGSDRGWGNMDHAPGAPGRQRLSAYADAYTSPIQEKAALKQHAEALQAELDAVMKRLSDMGKNSTTE